MSLKVKLKTFLAAKFNYGGKRALSNIKYIVLHYTGNDGDTDESNGRYFRNNRVEASAHYFVDDDSITQSVPDNYIAWHCGGKKYKHAKCRNANSIGIEICDDVRDGTVYPSAKTVENVLNLVEHLMDKYNIPKSNVIRHYDVTGKLCPAYWSGTAVRDKKWKTEFLDKIGTSNKKPVVVTKPSSTHYLVRITADKLNIRKGAGTKYDIVGNVKKNQVFTIVETKGTWGKLKSGAGWISLNYTKKV